MCPIDVQLNHTLPHAYPHVFGLHSPIIWPPITLQTPLTWRRFEVQARAERAGRHYWRGYGYTRACLPWLNWNERSGPVRTADPAQAFYLEKRLETDFWGMRLSTLH